MLKNAINTAEPSAQVRKQATDLSFGAHWLINFAVGLLCFVLMYTNGLVNHYDGIWAFSTYQSTEWEISIGRYMWPILNFIRGSYAGDPFNTILSLAVIALANTCILRLFNKLSNRRSALYSALITTSASFCAVLSYRFMSPTFALSYLFSVLSVYALNRSAHSVVGFVLSVVCVVCSLSLYQSMIGCTCLLIVVSGMCQCIKTGRKKSHHMQHLLVSGFSVLLGIIAYVIIWRLVMKVQNIAAVDYKGANALSVANILQQLPETIVHAYREFIRFFFRNSLLHSLFQSTVVYTITLIVLGLGMLFCIALIIRKSFLQGLMLLAYIAVIPVACNLCLLLAPNNSLEMQMTVPLALLIPTLLLFMDKVFAKLAGKISIRFATPALLCITALFLYGNVYQVACDQTAMLDGLNSSETLMNNVVSTAIENDLYDENGNWVFIGVPCENPMFQKSSLWNRANTYARFGQWWEGVNGQRSYRGMLRRLGVQWPMLSNDAYDAFVQANDETIRSMPLYPYEGSMQKIGDTVVVKISNSPYAPGVEKLVETEHPPVLNVWYDLSFAHAQSLIHVVTREDISHLTLLANDIEVGAWQENEIDIIEYAPQHCKEWIIPYAFEEADTYNLCFKTSYDGIRFFSYQDKPDTIIEISAAPIIDVEYQLGYANHPSSIVVITRDDTRYLTLNLGDRELGSWTSSDVIIEDAAQTGYKRWNIEYTFEYEGVYDLWYRCSADGNTYTPYSPGIENAAEILTDPNA